MTTLNRPVLRYHGGKWMLAPWIISHFPEHSSYTEVFGGAASVLMRKRRAKAEVYNDRWGIVVNVFKVLRDPYMAKELEKQIRLTPFSRDEFDQCGDIQLNDLRDPIEKARRTIFRSFAGFGSAATNAKYSTGFRASSSRSGGPPARDWFNYPNYIQAFCQRLQGVVIENREATTVLQHHDRPETLHYVDPPYPHSTRNVKRGNAHYAYELSDNEHIKLAESLNECKGMVIISGYENDLYAELFKTWRCVKTQAFADGGRKRQECLWMNSSVVARLSQKTLEFYQ